MRTRALTRGNRWRILLLIAGVVAAFLVIDAPFLLGFGAAASAIRGPARFVVGTLLNTVFSLLTNVGAAVVYVRLCKLNGGGEKRPAQVFA